jgi:hypothetical protein
LHFVRLVLATKGALPPGECEELDAVIAHLDGEARLGALPPRCSVARSRCALPTYPIWMPAPIPSAGPRRTIPDGFVELGGTSADFDRVTPLRDADNLRPVNCAPAYPILSPISGRAGDRYFLAGAAAGAGAAAFGAGIGGK